MIPSRVCIAAADGIAIERLLLTDPLFMVCDGPEGLENRMRNAAALEPDLLIVDEGAAGSTGLSAVIQLGDEMAAPPRILYLIRRERWNGGCRPYPVEKVLPWPLEPEELLMAARDAALRPLPELARKWDTLRHSLSEEMIARLGVPAGLKGRDYLAGAISDGACSPWLLQSLSEGIYPHLARRYDTTPLAVERAIRTAIEHTWLRGNLNEIQALFGFSVDADKGKPTNAECIAMLAQHVRRETACYLRKQNKNAEEA